MRQKFIFAHNEPRHTEEAEEKNVIKLILSDLDETLIHFGLEHATDHALDGIHAALDAGVHFSAITGRVFAGVLSAFDGDERCCATAAFSNGQVVRADGIILHRETLNPAGLQKVADLLRDEPDFVMCLTLGVEREHAQRFVISSDPTDARHAVSQGGDEITVCTTLPDAPVVKANIRVLADPERMEAMRRRLSEHVGGLRFFSPGPQVPLLDIAPENWSKAMGAEVLRRHLGLEPEEVAVFGDAENDLELIDLYPNSVAVANATDEVARAARWHIGASADDAVADAIAQIARATAAGRMPEFMCEEENERGLAMRSRPTGDRKVESLPIFTPRG